MLPRASSALPDYLSGLRDVPRYLLLELTDSGEPLLRPQPLHEGDIDNLPIQVPFIVQQVRLDPVVTPIERGRYAHVRARSVALITYPYMTRVYPPPGYQSARVRKDVSGGKAYSLAPFVTSHDLAAQEIGSPQEPRSLAHLASSDEA